MGDGRAGPEAFDSWNLRVLIVDDQPEIHEDFQEMLQDSNPSMASDDSEASFMPPRRPSARPAFKLQHATNGVDAYNMIAQAVHDGSPVAVAFVDIRMPPGINGIETAQRLHRLDRHVELVLMTAYSEPLPEIVEDVELLRKLLYIRKPFDREEIQQIARSLTAKWNVERELAASRRRLVESHRRLEAVLDATGDAIAMYDRDARLIFANRGYQRLFDLSEAALWDLPLGAALQLFTEPSRGAPVTADGPPATRGDETVVELKPADGGREPARLFYRSTQALRGDSGDRMGDLVVYRDLSREVVIESMRREVQLLRSELRSACSLSGIVGSSDGIRRACALVRRAAASDISVLIRGESGTGKELFAKALHFNGPRKAGPFLAVNCSAVPEGLIETELFGHERGAFTGATAARIGYLEQATGGTLFLDEVGDMPAGLQAKLLRVLQERDIRRVGGTVTIPVDVRVVAATNRDMEAAMRAGTFRDDLYYRLAVFPIVIPPLRTRPDDISLLADHFIEKHSVRLRTAVQGISPGALRLLARYAWPGNVRELENVICRALVMETTDVLQASSLPPELALPHTVPPAGVGVGAPLADVERQTIVRAVAAADGNLTQAAHALGINRATLYRKLKKYGLSASA